MGTDRKRSLFLSAAAAKAGYYLLGDRCPTFAISRARILGIRMIFEAFLGIISACAFTWIFAP